MRSCASSVLVIVLFVVHDSMPAKLCGRDLVMHVGNVCADTDCVIADEKVAMTSLRGLSLECCSRGCSIKKISEYCCSPHMVLRKAKKH